MILLGDLALMFSSILYQNDLFILLDWKPMWNVSRNWYLARKLKLPVAQKRAHAQ